MEIIATEQFRCYRIQADLLANSAGVYNNGVNDIAAIWKDGVKTDLLKVTGHDAYADSVYVDAN